MTTNFFVVVVVGIKVRENPKPDLFYPLNPLELYPLVQTY